jgi:glyoxylase-like metal-dependent hydrolase (beta-lactamase superfamily II)
VDPLYPEDLLAQGDNTVMQISPHCFAVTGLGYVSPWCVNAGFVAGGSTTLVIDTGGNWMAAQTIYGYARAASPGNRIMAVNTEKHFDHVGGNGYFRGLGIDVYGHAENYRTAEEFAAEIAEFNDAIPDGLRRERKEANAFFHRTELTTPNKKILEETTFDLGGLTAEVLFTPGHTPANLSIWIPRERVLYAGDCIVSLYRPNLEAGSSEDWRLWLASLDRIEGLRPAFVLGGHGDLLSAAELPSAIDIIRNDLREAIQRGMSPNRHFCKQNSDKTKSGYL